MPKHSRSKRNKVYTSFTNEPNMKSSKGAQNVGVCNICKKYGLLTFDHVPPISTRKIIQENSDFLKDKNFVLENCNKEGRFVQKLGFRTVCGKCNQIGGKYVNGFNRMIKHLLSHINEGMHKRTVSIKINLEDVYKQLLYMFIVQNDELKDHNLIPEFYRLLSNKGACKYTAKYTLVPNRIIHINKVTRIYMGFYTKSDLILHPDQAIVFDNEYNPGVDQENYNTMVINIKDVVSVISKGEYQNIIAFTPFYFKLFIGSNKSYDRDCDKLIDLSNFTSKSDIDQDFSLDIQQHDIDMPPKSYRSSAIFSLGKWAKK